MRRKRTLIASAAIGLVIAFTSCARQEPVAPYISEFVNAYTDSKGYICVIGNDKGKRFVTSDTARLLPDTVFRRLMVYVVNADSSSATIFSHSNVIASLPKKQSPTDSDSDPLSVRSVWISGGWMNLILEIKALDKKHQIYAIDQSDSKKVSFLIYHDENGDIRSHTKKAYMSIPLDYYYETLSVNDTVSLSYINYENDTVKYQIKSSPVRKDEIKRSLQEFSSGLQ